MEVRRCKTFSNSASKRTLTLCVPVSHRPGDSPWNLELPPDWNDTTPHRYVSIFVWAFRKHTRKSCSRILSLNWENAFSASQWSPWDPWKLPILQTIHYPDGITNTTCRNEHNGMPRANDTVCTRARAPTHTHTHTHTWGV